MTREQFYKAQDVLQEMTRYKKLLSDVNENLTSITFTTTHNDYTYGYSKSEEEILNMIKTVVADACDAKIEELLEELNQI